ncbi:MAG: S-layer homology domain-containing protein [Clostridia bacterium]|nr:S-layer homology domain-containing protein [Clostridia bacterium]
MKKLIALILTALMIFAALPMAAFGGRFTDVEDGKWYTEGINFCAANGYMAGVAEGVFDRKANVTRSMFVVILAAIDGVDLAPYESYTSFSDVAVGKWYTAAINWAAENNITAGIGDGLFGYKNPITREQMILFFYTYANLKGIDTSARGSVDSFTDSGRIHSWAEEAMKWGIAEGIIGGIGDGLLDPRGYSTRAQVAVVIRMFVLNVLSDCDHDFTVASCTEGSVCKNCGIRNSDPIGHTTDNGICGLCGAEIFASAHDKLVYYINLKGDPVSSTTKRLYKYVTIDEQSYHVSVIHNQETNEITLNTEVYYPDMSFNILNITLPDSNGTHYTLNNSFTGHLGPYIEGEFDANILDGYGDFIVTKYEGNEDDYALALVTTNYLLAFTAKYADKIISENANMSLTDYGFTMKGFSNIP